MFASSAPPVFNMPHAMALRPPAQAAAIQSQEEYSPSYEEAPKEISGFGKGGWGKASFSVELTPEEAALKQKIQHRQQEAPSLEVDRRAQTRTQPNRGPAIVRHHDSKEHVPQLVGEQSSLRLGLNWDCQKCQATNHRDRSYCQNCNRSRVDSATVQWRCPSCNWHNLQKLSRCSKCNSFHVEAGQEARIAQQWKHVARYKVRLPPNATPELKKSETPEGAERRERERKIEDERTRRLEQTKNGRFVAFRPLASQSSAGRDQAQRSRQPFSQIERPPVASSIRTQSADREMVTDSDRKRSQYRLGRTPKETETPLHQRQPVTAAEGAPSYSRNLQQDSPSQSATTPTSKATSISFGAGWNSYDGAESVLSETEKNQRPPQVHEPVDLPVADSNGPQIDDYESRISHRRTISTENHETRSPRTSNGSKTTSAADVSWLQSIDPSFSSKRKSSQGFRSWPVPSKVSKESSTTQGDISWLEATSSRPSSKADDRDRKRESERSARRAWKSELQWEEPQLDQAPPAASSYDHAANDQYVPGGHGQFMPRRENWTDATDSSPDLQPNRSSTWYNEATHSAPEPASARSRETSSDHNDALSDLDFAPSIIGSGTDSSPYYRSRGARASRRFRRRDEEDDSDWDEDREDRRQKRREQRKKEKAAQKRALPPTPVYLPEYISVGNLARVLRVRVEDFSRKMLSLGFEETNNDHVLGSEDAGLIAAEFNFEPIVDAASENRDLQARPPAENKSLLPSRPPIVTIMGHVDHGKTTLLDYLRKSSVAASEHGGITQHIGAFSVPMPGGRQITFLDTPGHAAFLSMRQRGANVTDIVILVVAADDSVKPQTVEAIKHAQAAKVPMIVAINKIDKEDKNIDRVKQDLARHGVEIEDFGGDTQVVCVSGKTGQGLDELEDAAVALADIIDMRAEVDGEAEGWVLEATTKKAGRVATVLVKRGTIRPGDVIVAGSTWAKIRTLKNEAGTQVSQAGPGTPVEVDGWKDQPTAGDEVLQAVTEQQAKSTIGFRLAKAEKEQMATDMSAVNESRRLEQEKRDATDDASSTPPAGTSTASKTNDLSPATSTNQDTILTLPIILKADVSGSIEACLNAITALGNPSIHPQVLRSAVGPISESDISLAASAGAQIVNFNQTTSSEIVRFAERENVKLVEENVIYRLTDLVKEALETLLPVKVEMKVLGEAEIAKSFEVGIGGSRTVWVAGCRVRNGLIAKKLKVRVLRGGEGGEVVFQGQLISLKHVKKDITEARKGMECGMSFENWSDFKEGDQVQSFEETEVKQHL
ncbi:MAG: hypothetical protein Q9172_002557 [Xanthocarpia lactea]